MIFTVIQGEVARAIWIMKEVATWGRSVGHRAWLDEWLTREELLTAEVSDADFCIGQVDGVRVV